MANKLMYILNYDTQNYPFCRLQLVGHLDTLSNEPTNQNSIKDPKVIKQTNKKSYYKTLGTSV